ncbi:unnamed protein product [Rhizophagus irregularis]|nr:unnamed protein product [Rhizophagus irregularis]
MHTPTVFDQTDRSGPLVYYNSASPDEYLSDSSSCTDNGSDLGSDDYNNYESNYKSDSKETSCASTSTTRTPLVQPHAIYSLRKEKFNNDFTPKDLLNEIRKISLSPPRDMSDIIDDISEVYGLPGIHECINGQKPLRAVIDIDALQEDMEVDGVKSNEVFIRICCSFIRALYRILDCNWEDILKGLVIATSSDSSKCSYHILYAPALLIDHHELKAFTELVYTITSGKFGKYIDRGLPGQNFNLRLIGSAKKGRVKHILQFSLDNGWNELEHARVQPPTSLRLEYSNYLRDWTIEEKDSENFVYFNRKAPLGCPLCKRIHDKDQRWFGRVYASSGEFIVKCFQQNSDKHGEIFECDPSIAEKIQQENKNSLQSSHKVKVPGFPKAFLKFPSWVKYNEPLSATETYEERYVKQLPNEVLSTRHSYSNAVTTRLNLKSYCDIDVSIIAQAQSHLAGQSIEKLYKLIQEARKDLQGIVCALKTDFPELRIKEYHGKSDPVEKAHDFSNVEEAWKVVDLVAYNSTLKIGVSCINPKSSNIPITEKGIFQWLLNAKRECLPRELQNRGIFPDIDSIIRNKDVPTIRLWVAYMLENFVPGAYLVGEWSISFKKLAWKFRS